MSTSPEYIYSELPAIELFQQLGYEYYNAGKEDERESITEFILKDRLLAAIQRINPWINEYNLQKAYEEITTIQATSLMEANQKVWQLIKGATLSVKQVIDGKEEWRPVSFIEYDFDKTDLNDFLVVSQMRFTGRGQNSVPDLVVYLNGLPVGMLECKTPNSPASWDKAYNDLDYYQKNTEKLFYYNQILAGIWGDGGKYGAINAPASFYSVFRSEETQELAKLIGKRPTEQDILIYHLFQKERLLDIIRHFVIFELNEEGITIKKLPRYQQIRAVNKTIPKLQAGKGGVIWHTQGSGKSITMAYLARKLHAPEYGFNNPTVVVMTDRKDLDVQITTTFGAVGFKNVRQASSVAGLDLLLRNDYGGIITTTLQKFQISEGNSTEIDQTLDEEDANLKIEKEIKDGVLIKTTRRFVGGKWDEEKEEIKLEQLSAKENLYVLVDEAHRSQYGFLAAFMRTVLPNAKFIAFTGTPISKQDKSTLGEFYGGEYLDVYTIKESVADGATVGLLYDEGIARLDVRKAELDAEFEARFGKESEEKKNKLKQEALRKYQLSSERIDAIARHIVDHFRGKIFTDKHKAMLVCDGRPAAVRYKQAIERLKDQGYHDYNTKVVVTLGSPKTDELAREYYETITWNRQNPDKLKPIWVTAPEDIKDASEDFKLPYGDESQLDKSGKKKKHDNTAFLIVSDMLLTGYDAPIASCLYLDKPLKEHNLLQAIARVNRSGKGKKAGFIVDYFGISAYLIQALEIFSGDIEPKDILKNLNEEIPILELNHSKLLDFFKPLRIDRKYQRDKYVDEAFRYLEPMDRRDQFKDLLKQFNKSLNIVLPNTSALRFFEDFKLYNEIKIRLRNAYPEDLDLKITKDESKMLQQLIDDHLKTTGVQNLLEEPISIIDREKFKEDILKASPSTKELKMRNQLKYVIKVGLAKNPDFYKPLAERLEALLKEKEAERLTQAQLILAMTEIQERIIDENKEGKDKGFTSEREIAVFNSMKTVFDEEAAIQTKALFELITGELDIIGWENKGMVQQDIENKIVRILKEKMERPVAREKAKEIVEILKKNKDS